MKLTLKFVMSTDIRQSLPDVKEMAAMFSSVMVDVTFSTCLERSCVDRSSSPRMRLLTCGKPACRGLLRAGSVTQNMDRLVITKNPSFCKSRVTSAPT